ncbi:hypothetical protein C1Y40_00625 [Mycobacterium talmoniae]|uniref:Uncharacterized protein n=1 Tax=Mycobacterium talmoniae TaxID=1858794 RepID=A0A2S8BRA0_9MYCO|nr:hypothetical protein C1Y40_00625 [Mycobacterium talmoniae]
MHVTVCQRHRRWIGAPARTLDDQKDLRNQHHVLAAARRHGALVRRYGTQRSITTLREARHILIYWANAEKSATAPILGTTLAAHIAAYPDLVGVASVLAAYSDHVEQPVTATGIGWPSYLLEQINQRTGRVHRDPGPLQDWVNHQRLIAEN